ncbi:MAG: DegT/DnrJ/EryC1/StrS aminotransferase family protein [Clostridiales bacterium]|nr:DegT/DnrJ/EryC1/StrS aminotransferase family protein [Clostridiales bacterium]
MKVLFSPPDITQQEIEGVMDTLRSGWITTGPKTKEFEKKIAKYCHTDGAVCLNSATACMEMTLRLFGIGPGDEVITTAYTYTATASSICHTGASLVMVDTQKDSLEMDYEQLEKAITPATKAILPVDVAGVLCDYKRIFDIVKKKQSEFQPSENRYQKALGRILVLADSAHGFGAWKEGKRSGQWADFTSFSFHAVKNLTTAEGGAVVWKPLSGIDSAEIYREYMLLSLHGQTKDALSKTKAGAWEYDILFPAYKCNMTDIQAAIGLAQLERYEGLLQRRQEIIQKYNDAMDDISKKTGVKLIYLPHHSEYAISSGHLYLLRVEGIDGEMRNAIIQSMGEKGVAANVHYKPLPLLTAYRNMGFDIEDYPHAYQQFVNEISLPLHTQLTDEQVDFVIAVFEEALLEVKGRR